MIIKRDWFENTISEYFNTYSVVAILGPRQCGKTTLAKQYAKTQPMVAWFDCESANDLAKLSDPILALSEKSGLIVVDEVQLLPDLFKTIRVLVDHPKVTQRFLILGSASRDLIQQSSETLAGRIAYLELTPFSFDEVDSIQKLWLRGGFPKSFLAENDKNSFTWREFYVSTFLERDIPQLGIQIPAHALRRFWMMLTHNHANIFNASELSRSLGISHVTARHYLDILAGTFMIRQMQPWYENTKKRQIKSPKIYFRDSGIFHALMNIETMPQLENHLKLGASWEGFALETIIRHLHLDNHHCFFWGVYEQGELDLLVLYRGKKWGFEFKYHSSPGMTSSLSMVMEQLKLEKLFVITPTDNDYALSDHIVVLGLKNFLQRRIIY